MRTNRDHEGVPALAARISGRSLAMVYKVRSGKAVSAPVSRVIEQAERELGITRVG